MGHSIDRVWQRRSRTCTVPVFCLKLSCSCWRFIASSRRGTNYNSGILSNLASTLVILVDQKKFLMPCEGRVCIARSEPRSLMTKRVKSVLFETIYATGDRHLCTCEHWRQSFSIYHIRVSNRSDTIFKPQLGRLNFENFQKREIFFPHTKIFSCAYKWVATECWSSVFIVKSDEILSFSAQQKNSWYIIW